MWPAFFTSLYAWTSFLRGKNNQWNTSWRHGSFHATLFIYLHNEMMYFLEHSYITNGKWTICRCRVYSFCLSIKCKRTQNNTHTHTQLTNSSADGFQPCLHCNCWSMLCFAVRAALEVCSRAEHDKINWSLRDGRSIPDGISPWSKTEIYHVSWFPSGQGISCLQLSRLVMPYVLDAWNMLSPQDHICEEHAYKTHLVQKSRSRSLCVVQESKSRSVVVVRASRN